MARKPSRSSGPLVVVIDAPIQPGAIERVRALSERITVVEQLTPEWLARAHVIYTTNGTFDPAQAPELRLIQVDTAAVNQFMDKPIAAGSVPVANVRGAYSPAVAEFTLGLMLTLTRRLDRCLDQQRQRRWLPDAEYPTVQGVNAYGKTMGIVGYGNIGRHLGRIANAMGMTVLACKRNPDAKKDTSFSFPGTGDPKGVVPAAWFGIEEVGKMLAVTDVAVVTVPLTPDTKSLLGRAQLEALPKHAIVISIGRGGVIDEQALADMLNQGRLAGAALDVFANEPLEPGSPLWAAPNTIITPHIASYTKEQQDLAAEVLIENLQRDLAGKPYVNIVDLKLGY